jgi:4-diphosphocytidyl-2-C-methyl-D-erythritol kinase
MIELLAPAKLTWYLEITGVRSDGMHELRSEMTTIDFYDRLWLDEHENYVRLRSARSDVPLDQSNLVARALTLLGRTAGVEIEKNIPIGGGLGGGSADAAALLRHFGSVSHEEALQLGADVPFCQLGGRALVEGIGERLTPLPFESRALTLVMPEFSVSTKDCYRAYDELARDGDQPRDDNHLEHAAGLVEPRVKTALAYLRARYGNDVRLAGSGSTMFVPGHVKNDETTWDETSPVGVLRFRHCTTTPQ